MGRNRKTAHYLKKLKEKNHEVYETLNKKWENTLNNLNNKNLNNKNWKETLNFFLEFFDTTWGEKDQIKKKEILGENAYNSFRGIAFEEFCHEVLKKIIHESGVKNKVELFWNEKILTEEFYVFEEGEFKKHQKFKTIDLAIGKRENRLIHPLIIISCKVVLTTDWLDQDRDIFEKIRNIYPEVIGYSLCMGLNLPKISLISAQRTGLKVFNLRKEFQNFIKDVEKLLQELFRSDDDRIIEKS